MPTGTSESHWWLSRLQEGVIWAPCYSEKFNRPATWLSTGACDFYTTCFIMRINLFKTKLKFCNVWDTVMQTISCVTGLEVPNVSNVRQACCPNHYILHSNQRYVLYIRYAQSAQCFLCTFFLLFLASHYSVRWCAGFLLHFSASSLAAFEIDLCPLHDLGI